MTTPHQTTDGATSGPNPSAGRRLHLIGTLTDEGPPVRTGAVHCTMMDGAITCQHAPEGSSAPITYPADDSFGRILVELMALTPPTEDADPPS